MKLLATIQERLLSAPADLRANKPRTFLPLFGFAIGFLPSSASLQQLMPWSQILSSHIGDGFGIGIVLRFIPARKDFRHSRVGIIKTKF